MRDHDLAAFAAVQPGLLAADADPRPDQPAAAAWAAAVADAADALLCLDECRAAAADLRHPAAGGGAGAPAHQRRRPRRLQAPVGLRHLHLVRPAAGCLLRAEEGAAL